MTFAAATFALLCLLASTARLPDPRQRVIGYDCFDMPIHENDADHRLWGLLGIVLWAAYAAAEASGGFAS